VSSREREIAVTPLGQLRGRLEGQIVAFRGVPYAGPPVGTLRFASPTPIGSWLGVRDATANGPIPPQAPSRAAAVMGDIDAPQDESCLTLTIWTPGANAERRPVLMWFHGGAFASGAGSLAWYDGGRLAALGNLVVVSVNYRLGALGYLLQPGVAPGNLGVLDQEAALRWVREHIAAFGGDPDNISLAGQSGGAHTIVSFLSFERTRGLFRRAILQSGPFGIGLHTKGEAARTAAAFAAALGLPADAAHSPAAYGSLGVDRILMAQSIVGRDLSRMQDGDLRPAFMPVEAPPYTVAGADLLAAGASAAAARGIPVMIGWTGEEANLFYGPDIARLDERQLGEKAARLLGDAAVARLALARARRPDGTPAQLFLDLVADNTIRLPSLEVAQRIAAAGGKAFAYQFDWSSPISWIAACHCIELPFVFGSYPAWSKPPMIGGADAAALARLSEMMMRSWIAFVTTGDPSNATVPEWRAFDAAGREVMHLDLQPRAGTA
jgi:para-nitrobenzyl esterase